MGRHRRLPMAAMPWGYLHVLAAALCCVANKAKENPGAVATKKPPKTPIGAASAGRSRRRHPSPAAVERRLAQLSLVERKPSRPRAAALRRSGSRETNIAPPAAAQRISARTMKAAPLFTASAFWPWGRG